MTTQSYTPRKDINAQEAVLLCENAVHKGFHLSTKTDKFNQNVELYLQSKTSGSLILMMNGIYYFLR